MFGNRFEYSIGKSIISFFPLSIFWIISFGALQDVKIAINERTDLLIQQNNKYIFDTIASELIGVKVINYFNSLSASADNNVKVPLILYSKEMLNEMIDDCVNFIFEYITSTIIKCN